MKFDSNSYKRIMAYYIRMLRLMRGYTQQDIADKLGKTTNAISNWELGNTSPSVDDMVALCEFLKVTPNQLCGWDKCDELTEYIQNSKEAEKRINELRQRKEEIEKEIRTMTDILNRKQ